MMGHIKDIRKVKASSYRIYYSNIFKRIYQTNSNSFTSLRKVLIQIIFYINNILFPIEPISDEYGNILYRMGDTTTYLDYYKIDFIDGPSKYNDKNIFIYNKSIC